MDIEKRENDDNKVKIILDLETSGLQSRDQIIQICLWDKVNDRLIYHSFCQPLCPIHPGATARNGINEQTLKNGNAKEWKKIWPDIYDILGGSDSIHAYFYSFDRRMLAQTCTINEIEIGNFLNELTWFDDVSWCNKAHEYEAQMVEEADKIKIPALRNKRRLIQK